MTYLIDLFAGGGDVFFFYFDLDVFAGANVPYGCETEVMEGAYIVRPCGSFTVGLSVI